jgi:hypothetical protein
LVESNPQIGTTGDLLTAIQAIYHRVDCELFDPLFHYSRTIRISGIPRAATAPPELIELGAPHAYWGEVFTAIDAEYRC